MVENNSAENKTNSFLHGSNINSLNSWLGLAGSVNIGYPSSYSNQNISNGNNGSNIGGSQGVNNLNGTINSGSGSA